MAKKQENSPTVATQKIYSRNSTFELAHTSNLKANDWKPNIEMSFKSTNRVLKDDLHEVTLAMTLKTSLEEQLLFTLTFEQAGAFTLKNITDEQKEHLLEVFCLSTLYPYACEAIASQVQRAGFPPLYLPPINFEARLRQKREKIAEKAGQV